MNPFIIVLAIAIPVMLLIIVGLWVTTGLINQHYQKYIFNEQNSVRSFIIDKERNVVKFFNINNVRNVRELTFDQFYVQFSKSDTVRLEEWINSLLRKNSGNVTPYIELEVYTNKNKKKYLSVFKATNIDKEKKIIHVDSYLFMHLTTRTKLGYKLMDIPLDEAIKKLKVAPSLKGTTYNFKFHFVNNINQPIPGNKLVFTEFKEIALTYAYPPQRYLIEVSESDFAIIDYRNGDNNDAVNFAYQIINAIKVFLELYGVLQNVQFSVGIVANRNFPSNAKKLILKAQEMSEIAYNNNSTIVTYNKDKVNNEEHSSEVDYIINNKKIIYNFSPVIDVKTCKPIGYYVFSTPINCSVKSMAELYEHSRRTDENKKLLAHLVKESSAIFANAKNDASLVLFRNLKFNDVPVFLNTIRSASSKEARNVACFEEYDISYFVSKNSFNAFKDTIDKMKAKGISSCLKLSDQTLNLESRIYSQFDYFIIDVNFDKIRKSTLSKLSYRIIAEKLLKYNRPIIVLHADGWSVVELLVRSGIEYISSNSLAPTDNTLTTMNIKSTLKLRKMLE